MFMTGWWGGSGREQECFTTSGSHQATRWLRQAPISCMIDRRNMNGKLVLPKSYAGQFHSHFIDKSISYKHATFKGAGAYNSTSCPERREPKFTGQQYQRLLQYSSGHQFTVHSTYATKYIYSYHK